MYFSKLLFLCFTTFALSKVVPSKKSYSCQEPPPHNFTAGCFVDLTIAVDMSFAMKSDANIATLVDSILTDLMPSFNFKETYTAGLAYGALSIGASNYFNNYADICQYIHSAQEQAIQLGLGYANLSEVFETYQITLLNNGRNYKKVLVLLTSVTDVKDIQTAKHFSDQLQASGVVVIVGALGNASATALSQLGNYVIEAEGFTLSATNITEDICQYGGITVTPAKPTVHVTSPPSTLPPTTRPPPTTTTPAKPPTTTTPPPHLTNHGIGTNCSTNVTNAWLDIALVFDISVAMSDEQLRDMLLETYGYLSKFTLNQIGEHTTRVALIPYADDATVVHSLNDVQSNAALRNALFSLKNRTKPYDFNVNVQNALQVAFDHLQTYVNYRPQIILLTAGAYRKAGFNGASHTADQIKENEITIFTVAFQAPDGVLDRNLSPLASPGYAYNSADKGLYTALPLALTQVNCFCFGGKIQFTVSNATAKRITKYADCVWGFAGETLPSIVFQYGCDSGVLAAITSQEKLDFVAHKIIPHDLFGRKAFTVGGHKVGEKWVWNGYNGTFPFESFPTFTEVSPSDKYSFFDPISSTDFAFKSTGDIARPYLCESRACDADYICDQSSKKRSLKKH